jgi:hypothetical protein
MSLLRFVTPTQRALIGLGFTAISAGAALLSLPVGLFVAGGLLVLSAYLVTMRNW